MTGFLRHRFVSGLWMELRPKLLLEGVAVWVAYNGVWELVPVAYGPRIETVFICCGVTVGLHDVY